MAGALLVAQFALKDDLDVVQSALHPQDLMPIHALTSPEALMTMAFWGRSMRSVLAASIFFTMSMPCNGRG